MSCCLAVLKIVSGGVSEIGVGSGCQISDDREGCKRGGRLCYAGKG